MVRVGVRIRVGFRVRVCVRVRVGVMVRVGLMVGVGVMVSVNAVYSLWESHATDSIRGSYYKMQHKNHFHFRKKNAIVSC